MPCVHLPTQSIYLLPTNFLWLQGMKCSRISSVISMRHVNCNLPVLSVPRTSGQAWKLNSRRLSSVQLSIFDTGDLHSPLPRLYVKTKGPKRGGERERVVVLDKWVTIAGKSFAVIFEWINSPLIGHLTGSALSRNSEKSRASPGIWSQRFCKVSRPLQKSGGHDYFKSTHRSTINANR